MSARTRKHPTKAGDPSRFLYFKEGKKAYAIPVEVVERYEVKVKETVWKTGYIAADDLFEELDAGSGGKAASLLKGVRARESLSQIEFAEAIGVSQANLSKMENGRRPIGKIVAKRIAAKFSVNYRYFLE